MSEENTDVGEAQECQNCFASFPADEPMIVVFPDAYDFCSYKCLAEFSAEQTHCFTHEALVDAVNGFNRRITAILSSTPSPLHEETT